MNTETYYEFKDISPKLLETLVDGKEYYVIKRIAGQDHNYFEVFSGGKFPSAMITKVQVPVVSVVNELTKQELRSKFFEECTDHGDLSNQQMRTNVPRVNISPHNLFEWFLPHLYSLQLNEPKTGEYEKCDCGRNLHIVKRCAVCDNDE